MRLWRSLYARPMWQSHLAQHLVELGAVEVPQYPCNFILRWNPSKYGGTINKEFVLFLNLYVDDLTLCGHESCHESFWTAIRRS